jgi:hypothetical protein
MVLTDFFVASASSAAKLLSGVGTKKLSRYETKGIDPTKLESLERLLKSEGETTVLTDEDAEQWVFLVSPSLVALLAKLDKVEPRSTREKPSQMLLRALWRTVAKKWAATAELKADRWTVEQAKKAISALVALAIEATAKKQDLLLRMSL